ncbi:hypothetical protein WAE61_16745 [Comamonadaceae bacterium PP-2]
MTDPTSPAGPPAHIPTLNDVLMPAPDERLADLPNPAAVEAAVVAQVMARIQPLLEHHLQTALNDLIQRESQRLAHQIREEIELVVRQCTEDALKPARPVR